MILIGFSLNNQVGNIRISGNKIEYGKLFGNQMFFMPIDQLKFDYDGILREFPDLKDKPEQEAREISVQRLKEHLAKMNSEEEVCKYVIEEIKKYGGIPRIKQKVGFRPERL
jgi:hypothetical protein